MNDRNQNRDEKNKLRNTIESKEKRKIRARSTHKELWFGLGMFGLVGWSVVVPTLLGLAIGIWLDGRLSTNISWTLTLFFAGLIMGCVNVWYWMNREGNQQKDNMGEGEQKDE